MGSGGGSGGGGGSSGAVDYPAYMKERHSELYDHMKDEVTLAISYNPYIGMQAHSPDNMINEMKATVDYYDEVIREFDPVNVWTTLMGQIPGVVFDMIDTGPLNEYINQQKIRLRHGIEDDVLPKYRRGMQDVGAVMTSAFKIGEALLWTREMEEEAAIEKEFKGKLSLAAYEYSFKSTNDVINLTLQKISYHKEVVHYNLEVLRMGYAAMKEWQDSMNVYAIERTKWALEMHKYLMDSLGSIASSAGTSYSTSTGGGSKVTSAIGGALAGAGTGAAVGGPWGAAIGGAVGLVAGLF